MIRINQGIEQQEQQGLIGIMAVITFVTISLSMLVGFSYHYRQSQLMVMQDLHAKQAFWLSESALEWGMTQHWDSTSHALNKWRCQVFSADNKLKSCFFFIDREQSLLQGQGVNSQGDKIYHYQWVYFPDKTSDAITPHKAGWLDFCPLKNKECAL